MSLTPRQTKAFDAGRELPLATGAINYARLASLGLTTRECDVMLWISEGKRDREIATILGLSPRTVEKHVSHIFEKLKVETRTAAVNQCRHSLAFSQAPFDAGRSAPEGGAPPSRLKRADTTQRHRRPTARGNSFGNWNKNRGT